MHAAVDDAVRLQMALVDVVLEDDLVARCVNDLEPHVGVEALDPPGSQLRRPLCVSRHAATLTRPRTGLPAGRRQVRASRTVAG